MIKNERRKKDSETIGIDALEQTIKYRWSFSVCRAKAGAFGKEMKVRNLTTGQLLSRGKFRKQILKQTGVDLNISKRDFEHLLQGLLAMAPALAEAA